MKMLFSAGLVLAMMVSGTVVASSPSGSNTFPDPGRANPKGGTYMDLDELRQYGEGMTKRQLYSLLGTPHFNEGFFRVREWNYLFNVRPAPGQSPVQCQMQIHFDKDVAVGHAWSPATCGALLQPPAAPQPLPPPAPVSRAPLQLAADALFAFDSAELSGAGRTAIDQAMQGHLQGPLELVVVGHTDRLGSAAYNQSLSLRRAESVRNYLVERGVPSSAIRAEGRGATQPVTECSEKARAALVACLAPNRRVEIVGIAAR